MATCCWLALIPEVSGGQPRGLPGVVPEIILKVPPYCCLAVEVAEAVMVGFTVAEGDADVGEADVVVFAGAAEVAGVVVVA